MVWTPKSDLLVTGIACVKLRWIQFNYKHFRYRFKTSDQRPAKFRNCGSMLVGFSGVFFWTSTSLLGCSKVLGGSLLIGLQKDRKRPIWMRPWRRWMLSPQISGKNSPDLFFVWLFQVRVRSGQSRNGCGWTKILLKKKFIPKIFGERLLPFWGAYFS